MLGAASSYIHFDGGGAFGLEAKIDVEDFEKAAQEQAGADQQHAGEGYFSDDEDGADAFVLAGLGRAGPESLSGFLEVAAGHAQSGYEAEEDRGRDGHEDGPGEGRQIDAQGAEQGNAMAP